MMVQQSNFAGAPQLKRREFCRKQKIDMCVNAKSLFVTRLLLYFNSTFDQTKAMSQQLFFSFL